MGLVKVPERENCHPQDLSFLSVIPRVSNFIHPVARFSLASGNRLRGSGSGPGIDKTVDLASCVRNYVSLYSRGREEGRRGTNESNAWSPCNSMIIS